MLRHFQDILRRVAVCNTYCHKSS